MRALEEPLRWIVANAGDEPSVVLNKVVEGKGNFGYNAATGEYGDMVEMGVLDPTKVTRYALQNAASVAGLILTTAAMVAEMPKEEHSHGGGGGHGRHGRHGRHGYVRALSCSGRPKSPASAGLFFLAPGRWSTPPPYRPFRFAATAA